MVTGSGWGSQGVEFVKVMKQLQAGNELDATQSRFMSMERPAEELYNIREDPFELNNLADDPDHSEIREKYAGILDQWIEETDDQGQYPESEEGLKLMLGIWGKNAINPEYETLRRQYPDLEGSLWEFKSRGWETVTSAADSLTKP